MRLREHSNATSRRVLPGNGSGLGRESAQQLVYSHFAQEIGVAVDTVKRWIDLLGRLHYGFLVRLWFINVAKALRKESKWFLRDWSGLADDGARAETLVVCQPAMARVESRLAVPAASGGRSRVERDVDQLGSGSTP
jgi:hypothetical protein